MTTNSEADSRGSAEVTDEFSTRVESAFSDLLSLKQGLREERGALVQREQALEQRVTAATERERKVSDRESAAEAKLSEVANREREVTARESEVERTLAESADRERALDERTAAVDRRETEATAREEGLATRAQVLEKVCAMLASARKALADPSADTIATANTVKKDDGTRSSAQIK